MQARLDISEHGNVPWRITEVIPDFELIDAWALPAEGTLEEFADLGAVFTRLKPGDDAGSRLSRALFALREFVGTLFGWDRETNTLPIPGCVETSLRERLSADFPKGPDATEDTSGFRTVFRTHDEWAMELSNSTVHAVLHLGWRPITEDTYRGQMGVYVKHRGRFGRLYMALIAPNRPHMEGTRESNLANSSYWLTESQS